MLPLLKEVGRYTRDFLVYIACISGVLFSVAFTLGLVWFAGEWLTTQPFWVVALAIILFVYLLGLAGTIILHFTEKKERKE